MQACGSWRHGGKVYASSSSECLMLMLLGPLNLAASTSCLKSEAWSGSRISFSWAHIKTCMHRSIQPVSKSPTAKNWLLSKYFIFIIDWSVYFFSKNGNIYMQMAANILNKLPCDVLYRIDVDFRIEETNLDSFIGRTAHIQFLEC